MLTLLFACAFWAILLRLAWVLLGDLRDHMNHQPLAAQDDFTPSMARWGYVGEKRGR